MLCTATQPALAQSDGFAGGFEDVRELAPEPKRLYQTLKRTRVRHEGQLDDAAVAERLHKSPQCLCIVNTRRHARELYERMADAEGAAHLTTLMCARHRREKLDDVRERLRNGAPVRLIATSLVEAGVDLDFREVWRAEAGLESIIQAAGRCNREGRAGTGDVFVFKPSDEEGHRPPPEVGRFADAARGVLQSHGYALSASLKRVFTRIETCRSCPGNRASYVVRGNAGDADFGYSTQTARRSIHEDRNRR